MNIEEARLYLEHTSKEDFNLEEHQKENRYQAIQVVLKEIERLKREKDIVLKLKHFVSNEIKRILKDDELSHIEKLQEIAKVIGVDKE